ncbi:MAG: hypothetical protein NTX25_15450 [Proteobacteria bacterium]|nr:hypothetical protein [Pseudomonadota bacterium]
MARAINQTIAWTLAFFLSALIFGIGLALVFSLQPNHKDFEAHENTHEDAHEPQANGHGGSTEHDTKTSGKESEHATEKADAPSHAKATSDSADEQEISASNVKAKTTDHDTHEETVPEAKPHH